MKVADISRELDHASAQGAVKDIIIPPCPQLLTELLAESQQRDPDPAKIARIASEDVAMSAALIRIANSPLYSRSRPARTVGDAVAMLGIGQSVAVLTGFLARNAIPTQSLMLAHFWESSTRRAFAMAYIARQMYGMDADVAHACGLFCHVGIPVMLHGLRGYSGTYVEAMARQDRSFSQTENAVHQTDHAVVGAIVAKTWRLPAEVSVAVRLHHDFTALSDSAIPDDIRNLVAMLAVADAMVTQFEGLDAQKEWIAQGPQCLKHLQFTDEEMENWADALRPVFEGAAAT